MPTINYYRAVLGPTTSQWYGTLVVSEIHYDGAIQKFLGITLQSPVEVNQADFNTEASPWVPTSVEISNSQNDNGRYDVQVKVNFEGDAPYKISPNLFRITIGINGNLTLDPELWIHSIALFADELPDISAGFSPRWLQHPPSAFARLVSQPATLTRFIGGIFRSGFGCCFGRDDSVDEKLPGEIKLSS